MQNNFFEAMVLSFDYTCDPVSLLVWAFAPAQFGSLTGWVGVDCKKAMK